MPPFSPYFNRQSQPMWYYMFELQAAAAEDDWRKVMSLMQDNRHFQLPDHPFTVSCFERAALSGRADVTGRMLQLGYPVAADPARLARLVERMAAEEKSRNTLALLLRGHHVPFAVVAESLAAEGNLPLLKEIRGEAPAACDFGGAFVIAARQGHAAVMEYIHEAGGNIFSAGTVRHMQGAVESFATPAAAERAMDCWRKLMRQEEETYAEAYKQVGGIRKIEDARFVPVECGLAPMNRLHIAARAGKFAEVIAVARQEKEAPLTAADFLCRDYQGVSLMDILVARGEMSLILDSALWAGRPEEAARTHAALSEQGYAPSEDMASFLARLGRDHLRQSVPRLRFP